MKQHIFLLAAMAALGVVSSDRGQSIGAEGAQASPAMSFFVSSTGSKTVNLGGLRGADKICQGLASAVGLGNKTWRAYLSAERDPDNGNKPTDERGQRVPGNWPNSPKPTVHDILTGSTADGRVMAGKTCNDWTSEASDQQAQVGHSDGLGPGGDPSGRYAIWNSSHENGSCADTAPRGGAGRIYCFAAK